MTENHKKIVDSFMVKSKGVITKPTGITAWRLPTGVLTLDRLLGGGVPSGTITQVIGRESTGKSTLCLHIIASALKEGHKVSFVPLEGWSKPYADALGVKEDDPNLSIWTAEFAEYTFNLLIDLIRNSDADVFVLDSITAPVTRKQLVKKQPVQEMDKGPEIAAKSRAISDFLDKIQGVVKQRQLVFICVNQLRSQITKMGGYDGPAGGKALQYYTDLKLWLTKKDIMVTPPYIETTLKIKKAKVWGVAQHSQTVLSVGGRVLGIDKVKDLVSACEKAGIVDKSGKWIKYGEHSWNGIPGASDFLNDNPAVLEELRTKYLEDPNDDLVEKMGSDWESVDGGD